MALISCPFCGENTPEYKSKCRHCGVIRQIIYEMNTEFNRAICRRQADEIECGGFQSEPQMTISTNLFYIMLLLILVMGVVLGMVLRPMTG